MVSAKKKLIVGGHACGYLDSAIIADGSKFGGFDSGSHLSSCVSSAGMTGMTGGGKKLSVKSKIPKGMVQVYIGSAVLYAPPQSISVLGLQEIRVAGEPSVYVFPKQKTQFEQAQQQQQQQNPGTAPMSFTGWMVAGAGMEVGALGAAAAFDFVGDTFFGGRSKKSIRNKKT